MVSQPIFVFFFSQVTNKFSHILYFVQSLFLWLKFGLRSAWGNLNEHYLLPHVSLKSKYIGQICIPIIISGWMCAHIVWSIYSFHIFSVHSKHQLCLWSQIKKKITQIVVFGSIHRTWKFLKAVLMSDYKKYWLKLVLVTTGTWLGTNCISF